MDPGSGGPPVRSLPGPHSGGGGGLGAPQLRQGRRHVQGLHTRRLPQGGHHRLNQTDDGLFRGRGEGRSRLGWRG